jgi:hypothetical protein
MDLRPPRELPKEDSEEDGADEPPEAPGERRPLTETGAEALIASLLEQAGPGRVFLEAVVDTTGCGAGVGPFLNLWVWRALPDEVYREALERVHESDDPGFLYDRLEELASSAFVWSVAALYPRWPDGLEAGDERLTAMLLAAAERLPKPMARVARFLFHHVGEEPTELRVPFG